MIRTILLIMLVGTLMTGCVAYKIERTEQFRPGDYRGLSTSDGELVSPRVVQVSKPGEGLNCFEPMLYVVTIGIIPAHCVDKYHVASSLQSEEPAEDLEPHFVVTSMQGWVPLFLPLSKKWKLGYGDNVVSEIEALIDQEQ